MPERSPFVYAPLRKPSEMIMSHTFMPDCIEGEEGLVKLNCLLAEGYGVYIFAPHFSKREMFQIPLALASKSQEVAKRRVLFPIAAHQYTDVLKFLEGIMQVEFASIVTASTKQKEAELTEKGKAIPWEIKKEGTGLREYLLRVKYFIASNGLVFLAPQATRMPHLGTLEGSPIKHVLHATRDVEKVACVIMGVEIKEAQSYEKDRVGGLNPFKLYIYRLGWVGTREQLMEMATEHGLSLDDEVLRLMDEVAPEPYRAKTPDGILIFSR